MTLILEQNLGQVFPDHHEQLVLPDLSDLAYLPDQADLPDLPYCQTPDQTKIKIRSNQKSGEAL